VAMVANHRNEVFIAARPSVPCLLLAHHNIARACPQHTQNRKVTRPDGDIAGRVVWDRREDGREAGADLNLAISRRRRP
jgi:hypothetical protein